MSFGAFLGGAAKGFTPAFQAGLNRRRQTERDVESDKRFDKQFAFQQDQAKRARFERVDVRRQQEMRDEATAQHRTAVLQFQKSKADAEKRMKLSKQVLELWKPGDDSAMISNKFDLLMLTLGIGQGKQDAGVKATLNTAKKIFSNMSDSQIGKAKSALTALLSQAVQSNASPEQMAEAIKRVVTDPSKVAEIAGQLGDVVGADVQSAAATEGGGGAVSIAGDFPDRAKSMRAATIQTQQIESGKRKVIADQRKTALDVQTKTLNEQKIERGKQVKFLGTARMPDGSLGVIKQTDNGFEVVAMSGSDKNISRKQKQVVRNIALNGKLPSKEAAKQFIPQPILDEPNQKKRQALADKWLKSPFNFLQSLGIGGGGSGIISNSPKPNLADELKKLLKHKE
jgi:hypothetical protein